MDDIIEFLTAFGSGILISFWLYMRNTKKEKEKLNTEHTQAIKQLQENFEEEKRMLCKEQEQRFVAHELALEEKMLTIKEELVQKGIRLEQEERLLEASKSEIERGKLLLAKEREQFIADVEKLSECTKEQAKELLMEAVKQNAMQDMAHLAHAVEMEEKQVIQQKAMRILSGIIQRCSSESVQACTVTSIHLVNEEMKGRLIGREGRNIRALEATTGVDIIIDNTPEVITLSAFNPIRRQIASMAIEILMQDGRIHPARIEEVVERCTQEINTTIREKGEQAIFDVGLYGVAPELVSLLGSLAYRTSFSQNMLQHSLEVATIAGMLAAELGVDIKDAKRAALFHDIGKAVDTAHEGSHARVGAEVLRKYGEAEHIVHAVEAHHEDIPVATVLDCIVQAADAISGARPGARKEVLENYIKRLETLESLAMQENGVVKAFAIQAGREIRVIVDAEIVNDAQSTLLAQTIAGKIRKELVLPGKIRVTVVREVRAVAIAS